MKSNDRSVWSNPCGDQQLADSSVLHSVVSVATPSMMHDAKRVVLCDGRASPHDLHFLPCAKVY